MTPTFAQVLQWHPASLGKLADYLTAQSRSLGIISDQVAVDYNSIPETEFAGDPRILGSEQVVASTHSIARDQVSLLRLAEAIRGSESDITRAVEDLKAVINSAQSAGCTVNLKTGEVRVSSWEIRRGGVAKRHYFSGAIQRAYQQVIEEDRRQAAIIEGLAPALALPHGPVATESSTIDANPVGIDTVEWLPGHSATVIGDVHTASTVITLVPGTGFHPEDLAGQLPRVRALQKAAGGNPEDTAVVLWHYDAPQSLTHAASAEYYSDETARLQNFQSALADRSVGKQVVVGYSYGSTLVAQATRGTGLHADQVLLVGSPGVGPGISSTRDMTLRRRDGAAYDVGDNSHRVAVATSRYDPIRVAAASGVHGRSPTAPEFGAQKLPMWEPAELPPFNSLSPLTSGRLREQRALEQLRAIGEAHTEHYFGNDVFDQQTRKWLSEGS